jgi:hypothetical protein
MRSQTLPLASKRKLSALQRDDNTKAEQLARTPPLRLANASKWASAIAGRESPAR